MMNNKPLRALLSILVGATITSIFGGLFGMIFFWLRPGTSSISMKESIAFGLQVGLSGGAIVMLVLQILSFIFSRWWGKDSE